MRTVDNWLRVDPSVQVSFLFVIRLLLLFYGQLLIFLEMFEVQGTCCFLRSFHRCFVVMRPTGLLKLLHRVESTVGLIIKVLIVRIIVKVLAVIDFLKRH